MKIRLIPFAMPLLLACQQALAKPDPDRPFSESQSVQAQPCNSGNWQWGKQLFWRNADTSKFADDRKAADNLLRTGVSPVLSAVSWAGSNRWGDTTIDTATAFQHNDPAWVAYTYWTYAHDSLTPKRANGTYNAPLGASNDYGWISAAMPMYPADCPDGRTKCVWGDWAAERVASLCAATHQVGIAAADFVDGFPGSIANQIDFHPRVVDAFADSLGITIPGSTDSARAKYITSKLMPQWVDFWGDAWAHFYSEIQRKVVLYSGRTPLVSGQCAWNVTYRRWMGVDFRRYYKAWPNPNSWYFGIELQGDYMRKLYSPGAFLGVFGTYCAWEPSLPLGAKLNIVDSNFLKSLKLSSIPFRDTAAMYNTQWFLVGYTHIANREGKVQRGAQAFQYGYADAAKSGRPQVTAALHAHIPRRVYGPGFYFSDSMVRSYESAGKIWSIVDDFDTAWNHAPHGYVVTDAAIDNLKPQAVPTCWIVTQPSRLPDSERRKLERFAPVVGADSAFKLSPIRADGLGRAWGFVDQDSSLVVVLTNMDTVPATYNVSIKGIPAGSTRLYDGIADTALSILPDSGKSVRVARMTVAGRETRPFVLKNVFTPPKPTGIQGSQNRAKRPVPLLRRSGGTMIAYPHVNQDGRTTWTDLGGHPIEP